MQPRSDPATEIVLCGLSSSSGTAGQEQAHPQLCHTRTLIKRCFKSWPCHCTAACCASHSLCSSTSSLKEQTPPENITLLNCGFGEGKRIKLQPSPETNNILPLQGKNLSVAAGPWEGMANSVQDSDGRDHTRGADNSHPHHSQHSWCSSDLSDREQVAAKTPHGPVGWLSSALGVPAANLTERGACSSTANP